MKLKTTLIVAIAVFISFCNPLFANPDSETKSIYSKLLGENREYWVNLPEQYNPNTPEKYPVIYLLDGMSLQENLSTVYNNYWGHFMPHCILVGISNQQNRTRDLTISAQDPAPKWNSKMQSGGAEKFTLFIEQELIPHIESQYKTSSYRTLIGHSYAGLFTINVFLNHSHLFTNYLAIDPSLDWADQKLLKTAKTKLNSNRYHNKSLVLTMASEQLHIFDASVNFDNVKQDKTEFTISPRSILSFADYAEADTTLNFKFQNYPEDLHGTVPLPSMMDGLKFLFEWFQFKSPQKYNNPETSIEEIKALLDTQAKIYKSHLGYDVPPMIEEMFNGYGYMNLQMGYPEKSKLFFELGIKYYPESANAYDSMADYNLSTNDTKSAIANVKKAYELSKSDYYKNRLIELQKGNQ
ncbi:MAG: esterase [Bacteroidetes bacterium MedPE-SWsnd-G2]|nr:MAG: esterase [Bacteroidetes bacterium MedPE-SWsnd-G2]